MTTLTKVQTITVEHYNRLYDVDKMWYEPVYKGEEIVSYSVKRMSEETQDEKKIKEMFTEIRTDLNSLSKKDFVNRADVLEMIEDCYGKLSKADFIQVIKNL